MRNQHPDRGPGEPRGSKLARLGILLSGIVLGQVILYGPSLAGWKILLPLDLLVQPGVYAPANGPVAADRAKSPFLVDLVYLDEPTRRFVGSELRAGRLPLWAPHHFAGAPLMWARFSPFCALQACTASPRVLAWSQLLVALVAGLGLYRFCRQALSLSFWPATIAAWCYPLTGFFVLWQGFATRLPVCWLPWLLLAVNSTVRGRIGPKSEVRSPKSEAISADSGWLGQPADRYRGRPAPLGLSLATCLTLVSGQLDVAGQVLLVSGLYGLWCLLNTHWGWRSRPWGRRGTKVNIEPSTSNVERGTSDVRGPARQVVLDVGCSPGPWSALVRLAAGWALGFLLAAPAVWPVVEYAQTGARVAERRASKEERPPVGLAALPQVVLPKMYGLQERGSVPIFPNGQTSYVESSAAAYAGVLATLFLAPLAWLSHRHRHADWFWAFLVVLGLGWCVNLPGVVHLLRLPGLNMMSHNRLVFAASLALVVLAATGLEGLLGEPVEWRRWFWLPVALLAAAAAWCLYRTVELPEPVATQLDQAILQAGQVVPAGHQGVGVQGIEDVQRVQAWFAKEYAVAALLCGIGMVGWGIVRLRGRWPLGFIRVLGGLWAADLLWFGYGRSVQSAPELYYPQVPVLEELARAAPGRVMGCDCLPPNLAYMCGLRDTRGYDGVDPARLVELELLAADPRSTIADYARTQWLIPRTTVTSGGDVQLSPIFDMLGVRYLIFRGVPDPKTRPVFRGPDYWVLENPDAMPRAYIPKRVELVVDNAARLRKLNAPDFDPRDVAYVESPVDLPLPARGTVQVVDEIPTRVRLSFRTETPALVVLADLWDQGWQAYLNGRRVPILRANHALRGVVVPAGAGILDFRYEPASFTWGLRLCGLGAAVLLAWSWFAWWEGRIDPAARPAASASAG
jgi:hypothetical protein